MKISILQENLNKGFSLVSRTIGAKTTLPILNNILITGEEGKLKLTTTNLETGINLWLPAKKEKEGKFTIPAKDITEFVASLPAGKISLEQKQEKLQIILGTYKAVFNGTSAAEFPEVPSLRDKKTSSKISKKFEIGRKKFVEMVNHVCFSAAIDETRPVLSGVRLSSNDKNLQLVATDGYRLSLKKIKLGAKTNISTLIIPARTLMEVMKVAEAEGEEGEGEKVQIAVVEEFNQVIFAFNNTEVVARLIEGEFPDFKKIIPEKGENKATIDKEEFSQAIRAASIFSRKSANIVRFEFSGSRLLIKANAPEVGENEISLAIKYQGKEMKIAFNYRFLQDYLNSLKQDAFSLEFSGPLKPGLFRAEKDPSFLHIIMPVRVQA
jgi:DNA polymerase-3 subunit beta